MFPKVFFSLSGKEAQFVENVRKNLPSGIAFFYEKSFQNGHSLLQEMERGIENSSVFVLFASRESLESVWVNFELDLARLSKIRRPNLRLLIFPLTPDLPPSMFPEWMRSYWIEKAGFSPKDIARYIWNVITASPIASPAIATQTYGRGTLLDKASRQFMSIVNDNQQTPNVMIFTGLSGIGRKTFSVSFLDHCFPSLPQLKDGPTIHLPLFADIADLYRTLRELIEISFSLEKFREDLTHFQNLSLDQQVEEVILSLSYFSKIDQAVFVKTGAGLFEDSGEFKSWAAGLIARLADRQDIKIVFVSNRWAKEIDDQKQPHVFQFPVPALENGDIKALLQSIAAQLKMQTLNIDEQLLNAIGGHPQLAKAAIRLLTHRGVHLLSRDPQALIKVQDAILSENLRVEILTPRQKDILCLLSWVPKLEGKILQEVISNRHGADENDYLKDLEDLLMGSLIAADVMHFSISQPIRMMYRRKTGHGDPTLLNTFSKILHKEWDEALQNGDMRSDLLDAFVFMHALEGKSMPDELKSLLLPSTLRDILRDTYARGRDSSTQDEYEQVIAWGTAAQQMRIDDATLEEILMLVVQSYIRLKQYRKAENLLTDFDRKGYKSSAYLRGFSLRRQKNYQEAIPYLKRAVSSRKYSNYSVQELATCYQALGMTPELEQLIRDNSNVVERSASLLYFRIGMHLAKKDTTQAERDIELLRQLADDNGRSICREAQTLMQRDNAFKKAEAILSFAIENGTGDKLLLREWRARAAIRGNNLPQALEDIDFLSSRPDREDVSMYLKSEYALAKGEYKKAENFFSSLPKHPKYTSLQIRILEHKTLDPTISLGDRNAAKEDIASLKAQNRHINEYSV